jgi:hypothetical protein
MRRLFSFLSRLGTGRLVLLFILAGLVPCAILRLVYGGHYSGTLPEDILIGLMFTLWGCIGLTIVIRRETPGFIRIRGKWAVLEGLLVMACFWSIVVIALLGTINKLIK